MQHSQHHRERWRPAQPPLLTLLLLLLSPTRTVGAATLPASSSTADSTSASSIDCGLYQRIAAAAATDTPAVLDCRRAAVAGYESRGYWARHKVLLLLPARATGLPVWTLSPPLAEPEFINVLPAEAFADLAQVVTSSQLLSLRRLHQPELDLQALARLPQLRHLEVADSNATCLRGGLFAGLPQLASLRLVGNTRLACIQAGALAELADLAELRIAGSPGLKTLNAVAAAPRLADLRIDAASGDAQQQAGALCGARSLRQLSVVGEIPDLGLLAGLSGLRALRIESADGDMPTVVAKLTAAFCAQWPDGRLLVNGFSIGNWTQGHMFTSYAELCSELEIEVDQFAGQARDLCKPEAYPAASVRFLPDSCQEHCPVLAPVSTPILYQSTSSPKTTSATTFASDYSTSSSPPSSPSAAAAPGTDGAGVWSVEHQGAVGTALLTAGAFIGGALVAAYCCQSRRLGQLKPMIVGAAGSSSGGGGINGDGISGGRNRNRIAVSGITHELLAPDEPIRLIGYSLKKAAPLDVEAAAATEAAKVDGLLPMPLITAA